MKKARMNSSHFYFILFNLKFFGEIVTTILFLFAKPYTNFFTCFSLISITYHQQLKLDKHYGRLAKIMHLLNDYANA